MSTDRIDEWALHAYVDNEVSGEQRAEIEARLRADPELAKTVDAWRRQRDLLKQTFDSVLDEPLPRSLAATLRTGGAPAFRPYFAIAAALALLIFGGLGGWFLKNGQPVPMATSIAQDALAAYEVYSVEVRHPVEVAADDPQHLRTWLSKRVGVDFKVPDLVAEGYSLVGGRLLPAGDQPAAMLMYEDATKNRIALVLTAEPKGEETALHVEQKGKLIACYWRSEKLAFAVAGEMAEEPMMKLAKAIYEQFDS